MLHIYQHQVSLSVLTYRTYMYHRHSSFFLFFFFYLPFFVFVFLALASYQYPIKKLLLLQMETTMWLEVLDVYLDLEGKFKFFSICF